MQIILLEKVVKLGNFGDIVKVKKGYARNFLIPQKRACRATKETIAEFETRRIEFERIAAEKFMTAQIQGKKLAGLTIQIVQKAGVDGRLFGSVTNVDIVKALSKQGFDIEKTQVRLPRGPLKIIGNHLAHIYLHTNVTVDLTVAVVGNSPLLIDR